MNERTPSGELTKRVRIVSLVDLTDGSSGQPQKNPVIRFSAWAKITPLTGRELERAKQIVATVTHEIRMPYRRHGPTAKDQIWWMSDTVQKVFNVGSVIDVDEGHFEFVLMCTQVVV